MKMFPGFMRKKELLNFEKNPLAEVEEDWVITLRDRLSNMNQVEWLAETDEYGIRGVTSGPRNEQIEEIIRIEKEKMKAERIPEQKVEQQEEAVKYRTSEPKKLFDFEEMVNEGTKEEAQKKREKTSMARASVYSRLEEDSVMTQEKIDKINAEIDFYKGLKRKFEKYKKTVETRTEAAKAIEKEKEEVLQLMKENVQSKKKALPEYEPSVDETEKLEKAEAELLEIKDVYRKYATVRDNLPNSKQDLEKRNGLTVPVDEKLSELSVSLSQLKEKKERLNAEIEQNRSRYLELKDSDLSEKLDIPGIIRARVELLTQNEEFVRSSIVHHIEEKWTAKKAEKEEQISRDYSKFQRDEEKLREEMRQQSVAYADEIEEYRGRCELELDKIVKREREKQTKMTEEYPSVLEEKKQEIMREIEKEIKSIDQLEQDKSRFENGFTNVVGRTYGSLATAEELHNAVVEYGDRSNLNSILDKVASREFATPFTVSNSLDVIATQVLKGNDWNSFRNPGGQIKFFSKLQQNAGRRDALDSTKVLFHLFEGDNGKALEDIRSRIESQLVNADLSEGDKEQYKNEDFPVSTEEVQETARTRLKDFFSKNQEFQETMKLFNDKLSKFQDSSGNAFAQHEVLQRMTDMGIKPRWVHPPPPPGPKPV